MRLHEDKTLAIIGQGYVGLPLAMAALASGFQVIGIDTDSTKVGKINSGVSPVEDVSEEQLKSAIASRMYLASTDYSLVSQACIIAICVPTPLNDVREPDLAMLKGAVEGIAVHVKPQSLVISESTSFPGTLREIIIPMFHSLRPDLKHSIFFASAPERVNPGDLVWSQKNTPRLVGGIDALSTEKAKEFYSAICDAIVKVSSPEVAEAAKLFENTFRLVNIALVNEFTQICERSGLSINEVLDAASTKPYGFLPFRPGVGVGGHCIPVDPLYLTWWARKNGISAELVESADSINQAMPKYVAKRALSLVNSEVSSPKVLILGIAYKPGVSDVRETPATELWNQLRSLGAEVAWHDPLVSNWQGVHPQTLDWNCDIAILATNQPGMNLDLLFNRGVKILDCTNSLNLDANVTVL
jgi:UDP-N-acetyl-D-glucosamine dehydrogenase